MHYIHRLRGFMKKQILMVLLLCSSVLKIESFTYINGQPISIVSLTADSCCEEIHYNILNSGNGVYSDQKRYFGIHNMSIDMPGYERVWLIKDDICLYPKLFTLVAQILPKNFFVTQRFACIQSSLPVLPLLLPLTLGFKLNDDVLTIFSSTFRYAMLAPFWTKEEISLVRKNDGKWSSTPTLAVSVNGTTVVVGVEKAVQLSNASTYWATVATAPYVAVGAVIAVLAMTACQMAKSY